MLIFWDIDGTLMYCGADGTKALNEAFYRLYGIEDAFMAAGIGGSTDSAILDKIMKEFGIQEADADKIKNNYIECLEKILRNDEDNRVLPGVREMLSLLDKKGHINSLLTSNIKTGAYTKLKSVGLDGLFFYGGFGDTSSVIKDEKWDIAGIAMKEIETLTKKEISPRDVVLIGDSVYDIKTARKSGFKIISVATGWTDYGDLLVADPDHLFEDLSDTDAVMAVIDMMGETE